jgi:hypothetical protein
VSWSVAEALAVGTNTVDSDKATAIKAKAHASRMGSVMSLMEKQTGIAE